MFEHLNVMLNIDPILIGIFAGLSMMIVQMLKNSNMWVENNPMLANLILAIFFSTMVVFEVTWVLSIAILTFLIMSSASGVYSTTKKNTVINYSDDK